MSTPQVLTKFGTAQQQVPTAQKTGSIDQKKGGLYIHKELVEKLMLMLKQACTPLDGCATENEAVNYVLMQMAKIVFEQGPLYSKLVPGTGAKHLFFGQSGLDMVQAVELKDKGRFIDACLIAYLLGPKGVAEFCTAGRVLYPRRLTDQEMTDVSRQVAVIAKNTSGTVEAEMSLPSSDLNLGPLVS